MGDIIGIRPEAESIQAYYSSDQSISLFLKVKILTLNHVITIYKDNEMHEELIVISATVVYAVVLERSLCTFFG